MPQYQGVWSLQQQMQALTSGQWATDPNFKNTTLLLQGDNAANSAQNNTFLDSSTNAFAITRNGNTTQGSFSPFSQSPGWWSNYFDGSSNITLSSAAVQTNGAFTVECWLYITNNTGTGSQGFYTQYAAADGARMQMLFDDSDKKFKLTIGGSSYPSTQAYPGVYNTWTHVVFTRDGSNNFSIYVNGLRDSVTTVTAGITSVNPVIGNRNGGGIPFYGYISNLRITTTAVYSGTSFAVPNLPLGQVSGALLLTCQSYRFVDNSASPLTLTPAGTPSVQPFSPFAPQYQWTSDVIGGSGYFDGNGDILTWTDSSNVLDLGGTQASAEWWFYPLSTSATQVIMYKGGGATNWNLTNGFEWQIQFVSQRFTFAYSDGGGGVSTIADTTTRGINQWYHVAVATNSSNAISLFVNGSRVATATGAIGKPSSRTSMGLGSDLSGNFYLGYSSGSRIIKGSGAYDAAQTTITVPTSPPTAVSNTQLLLNFTNAGILDGTMKNNLETVGNAQVSTSVVKYGSGSMYFDGTGDYLIFKTSPLYAFGTGDFTVEAWMFPTTLSSSTNAGLVGINASGGYAWLVNVLSDKITVFTTGTTTNTFTTPVQTNVWQHLAITRANGLLRCFLNGVQVGSAISLTSNLTSAVPLSVGANQDGGPSQYFTGYIDDLRITTGVARYITSFTPPSVALPRQ